MGSHPGSGRVEAQDRGLTARSLFTLDYIAVPPPLTPYVTTFYHFRCDEPEFRDIQPSAIGHLAIFPRGRGAMHFHNGSTDPSHEINLMTPFARAVPYAVEGRFHAIGAALTPLGWAALTGMDAARHGNRLLRAGDALGEEVEDLGRRLCADYRAGKLDGPACAEQLGEYILAHLRPVYPRHARLIATAGSWLGSSIHPPIEALYARAHYSERQVQRLLERYFGMPPRELSRKYRALRAAIMLSLPVLSDEAEAELAEAFYDEPHMIREIRYFVGRSPKRLAAAENRLLGELVNERNLRELEPRIEPQMPE